jgi:uncharacterized protein
MRFAYVRAGLYALAAVLAITIFGVAILNMPCADDNEEKTLEFFRALETSDSAGAQALLKYIDLAASDAREGLTPLHWAVLSGNAELIAQMIERILKDAKGTDGAPPALLNARDAHGCTPLMWAAGDGNLAALEALVPAGADLNLQSPSGNTALHYAIASARPITKRIAQRLLEAGANIRIQNSNGEDAFAYARTRARPDMLEILAAAKESAEVGNDAR